MSENSEVAEVGRRLRLLREMFDCSQEKIGEVCGVHQSNYSKIEKGKIGITPSQAMKLADFYRVDLDYIYRGHELHGPRSDHGDTRPTQKALDSM
jgi:transcriptional regulator with XRE-family HTH domain